MVLSAIEDCPLLIQLEFLLKEQKPLLLHSKLGPLNSIVKVKILSVFAIMDSLRASLFSSPRTLFSAELTTTIGKSVFKSVKLLSGGAGSHLIFAATTN